MSIIPRQEQPYDLVCACCGSDDLRIADSHGWMRCEDCGEEDYAIAREDWEPSEARQGLIPIPAEYAEQ